MGLIFNIRQECFFEYHSIHTLVKIEICAQIFIRTSQSFDSLSAITVIAVSIEYCTNDWSVIRVSVVSDCFVG